METHDFYTADAPAAAASPPNARTVEQVVESLRKKAGRTPPQDDRLSEGTVFGDYYRKLLTQRD